MPKQDISPEIHIFVQQRHKAGNYHVRVADPQKKQVIFEQQIKHNAVDLQAQYMNSLLEGHVRGDRRQELTRYGQKLFRQLFGDGRQLHSYLKKQRHFQNGARFILRFDQSAADLWNAPWEYIHNNEHFMLIDDQNMMIRTPALDSRQKKALNTNEQPSPLRILVFFSEPDNIPPLGIDQEAKLILEALDEALDKHQVIVDIVEEGSLYSLQSQLQQQDYHVLHYSGHGGNHQGRSFLAFEGLAGEATPVYVDDLLPLIREHAPNLRLFMLSGCQTGQIDESEAMNALATGLLHVVPAVIAMQFSINDDSATAFAKAFYNTISQGETVEEAMTAARREIKQRKSGLNDWGVPSLYMRSRNLRLIDPAATPTALKSRVKPDIGHLPHPELFVGRRKELRKLRQGLLDTAVNLMVVWGIGGSGKSALVGRVLEQPGRANAIEASLILDCATIKPLEIPRLILEWLHENGCRDAVKQITKSHLPIPERIVEASRTMHERRFVIVLDGFDALMQSNNGRWRLADERLFEFVSGLAQAEWHTRLIITSRYYWHYLNELDSGRYIHTQLNNLDIASAYRAARILPSVLKAETEEQGLLAYRSGGHPSTLYLIDQYLRETPPEGSLKERLESEQLDKYVAQHWHKKFLGALLDELAPPERRALEAASILDGEFWEEHLCLIADIDQQTAARVLARLEILSLVQYERTDEEGDIWYTLQPVVRWVIYHNLPDKLKRRFHLRAAGMASRFFIDAAEEFFEKQTSQKLAAADRTEAAEMVISALLRHYVTDFAKGVMEQALIWRSHLYKAGKYRQAAAIVRQIWLTLYEWGSRPFAKQLIEETIKTCRGTDKALAQVSLAEFIMHEGNLERSMAIYENAYSYFMQQKDKSNAAYALLKKSAIHLRRGKQHQAQKVAEKSLGLYLDEQDRRGVLNVLVTLTDIHLQRDDLENAINKSIKAEDLARELQDLHTLGVILRDQAQLWVRIGDLREAFNHLQTSLQIAAQLELQWEICRTLADMGNVLHTAGDLEAAKKTYLESLSIAQSLENFKAIGQRYLSLGKIHAAEGNKEEALVMYERAENILQEHGSYEQVREVRAEIKNLQGAGRRWLASIGLTG